MNFDPWNRPLKIEESIGTPTPNWECGGFIPLHFLALLGT